LPALHIVEVFESNRNKLCATRIFQQALTLTLIELFLVRTPDTASIACFSPIE
jgi:hypothetical protein